MKLSTRIGTRIAWSIVLPVILLIGLLALTGAARADTGAAQAGAMVLARIELAGPLDALDLPVYAHLQDAAGQEYALVVAPQARVAQSGRAYEVLDVDARGPAYVVALERRPGARRQAARLDTLRYTLLYDDGRHLIARATPAQAEALSAMGFDLQRLDSVPMLVRAPTHRLVESAADFAYDPLVAAMVAQVQQATVYTYTGRLSGEWPAVVGGAPYLITTRHTNSGTPIQKATQYVYEHMQALGLAVSYHNWTSGSYTNRNVIGTLTGTTRPDEIVLVTAHLDDMPSGGLAPGADDNASGSVAVLVAADILSRYRFERTLRCVFFTGEEQGLYGSTQYAALVQAAGENVVAVYNMDMIAWDSSGGPTLRLHTRTTGNPGYASDLAIAGVFTNVVATYGLSGHLTPILDPDGITASDHAPFWNRGYAAILAIEDDVDDFNNYYHTVNDKLQYLNMDYFTSYVKASVGTVAHLARPYGQFGTLNGTVSDAAALVPLEGVQIQATAGPTRTSETDSQPDGLYSLLLLSDTYRVTAATYGYHPEQIDNVSVVSGTTTTLDIALAPAARHVVSGTVTSAGTGAPLQAAIKITGQPFDPPTATLQTDPAGGFYSVTLAEGITYTFSASSPLHAPANAVVAPLVGDLGLDFALDAVTTDGLLWGHVTNRVTGAAVPGALVRATPGLTGTQSGPDGAYQLQLPSGTPFTITVSAPLYGSVVETGVILPQSNLLEQDYSLPTAHMALLPSQGISASLYLGQRVTHTLLISNSGAGELDFEIVESQANFVPTPASAGGGPDPFGYTYRDSEEPGGALFAWVDATHGTPLNLGDDQAANVTLPFAFTFYGSASTVLRVGNNGGVLFGATSGDLSATNAALGTATASNLIAPFWDDIDDETGNVYYKTVGSAPNRRFVVQWHARPHYQSGGGVGMVTFELVLYEGTHNLKFQYQDVVFGDPANPGWDYGGSATVGIRQGGSNYLQYAYNQPALRDGLAICYQYPGSPPCDVQEIPWLLAQPLSGTLAGGALLPVTLSMDAGTLTQTGQYGGELIVRSNDPAAQPYATYPLTLNVLPALPVLGVGQAASAQAVEAGLELTYTLSVTNSGGPATGVVISAPLPAHTTLAWAGDGGTQVGDAVVWSGLTVSASAPCVVRYRLALGCVISGSAVVNQGYRVLANEWTTPTLGQPLTVTAVTQGVAAGFTYPTPVLRGQALAFTNLSQRANSYAWAFGDGGSSQAANPLHTYSGAVGPYTVVLTASTPCTHAVTSQILALHDYALALAPGTASAGGDPGSVVRHTLRVTNTGTLPDLLEIVHSGSAWPTALTTHTLALEPGAGSELQVEVTVPPGADGGAEDSVTLTARSQVDPRTPPTAGSAVLSTRANNRYGLAVAPGAAAQAAPPGATVTYTLRVTNTGNAVDTFGLSRTVSGWPTVLSAANLTIARGGWRAVKVAVTLPLTAADGAYDTAVIRVNGGGGYAEVTLTTTAALPYRCYLPLMLKSTP